MHSQEYWGNRDLEKQRNVTRAPSPFDTLTLIVIADIVCQVVQWAVVRIGLVAFDEYVMF